MDRITLLGVRFPAEMMLLLKSLYTLNGVLREISTKVRIDLTVAGYALKLLLLESRGVNSACRSTPRRTSPATCRTTT